MPTVRYTVMDGEIVAEKRDGVRRSYVPDAIGSTVALLDNAQTQTDTFAYWPYGEEKSRTGSAEVPFRFFGTRDFYRDSDRILYNVFQFYDPRLGRWLPSGTVGSREDLTHSSGTGAWIPPPAWPIIGAGAREVCKRYLVPVVVGGCKAGWRWITRCFKRGGEKKIPPWTPCTPLELAALNAMVEFYCKTNKTSCNPQMRPCQFMLVHAEAALACYAARNYRDTKCFRKGNPSHIQEQNRALENA